MKHFSICIAVLILALTACNNENKENKDVITESPSEVTTETTTVPSTSTQKTGLPDDVDVKAEALKKQTPLTLDQLKGLLPEEINGAKRSGFDGTSNEKLALASAKYIQSGNKELEILLQDCRGQGGANVFRGQYALLANADASANAGYLTENTNGHLKVIDHMGKKAVETYDNKQKKAELSFIDNDILVTLRGKGMTTEEIKEVAQHLKLTIKQQ
jgi:hypothetical protein